MRALSGESRARLSTPNSEMRKGSDVALETSLNLMPHCDEPTRARVRAGNGGTTHKLPKDLPRYTAIDQKSTEALCCDMICSELNPVCDALDRLHTAAGGRGRRRTPS